MTFLSLQIQTMFQFIFIEINSIQSIFFHSHEFRCSMDTLIKRCRCISTVNAWSMRLLFSLCYPSFCKLQYQISFTSPLKAFTYTDCNNSLTLSWLSSLTSQHYMGWCILGMMWCFLLTFTKDAPSCG